MSSSGTWNPPKKSAKGHTHSPLHPRKKKISWCVSSQPHNFRVITQEYGLIEQVKVNKSRLPLTLKEVLDWVPKKGYSGNRIAQPAWHNLTKFYLRMGNSPQGLQNEHTGFESVRGNRGFKLPNPVLLNGSEFNQKMDFINVGSTQPLPHWIQSLGA